MGFILKDVKLVSSQDMGSFVMLFGKTQKDEDIAIPLDYRMFDSMFDDLTPEQRTGKDFVPLYVETSALPF